MVLLDSSRNQTSPLNKTKPPAPRRSRGSSSMLLAGFSSSCSEQFNNRKMLQGGGGAACPACFPEVPVPLGSRPRGLRRLRRRPGWASSVQPCAAAEWRCASPGAPSSCLLPAFWHLVLAAAKKRAGAPGKSGRCRVPGGASLLARRRAPRALGAPACSAGVLFSFHLSYLFPVISIILSQPEEEATNVQK